MLLSGLHMIEQSFTVLTFPRTTKQWRPSLSASTRLVDHLPDSFHPLTVQRSGAVSFSPHATDRVVRPRRET